MRLSQRSIRSEGKSLSDQTGVANERFTSIAHEERVGENSKSKA